MNINICIQNFQTLSLLGQGTYARVFLIRHLSSQQLMAAKIMKKKDIQKRKAVSQILNEKNILSELEHPFVMKLNCSFQNKHNLFLIMEYCPGGQLFRLIEKKGKLNENQASFYATQIVLALQYLHSKSIVYRDLKPENIVIDQKGYIKITDFGLSGYLPCDKSEMFGTPQYFSPQIIAQKQHGKQVDWWCLGLIIYEMVVGQPAFQASNKTVLMEKITSEQPFYPANMSNKLKNLLHQLLKKNPSERLGSNGSSQVLQHPWFQKMNLQQLLNKQIVPPIVTALKSKVDVSNFDSKFTSTVFEAPQQQEISQSDTEDQGKDKDEFKGYECMKIQLPVKKLKLKNHKSLS